MGKKVTRSQTNDIVSSLEEFSDQKILGLEETCSYTHDDINKLLRSDAFPGETVIKGPDPLMKADLVSPNWIAFPEYPFTLGLKYPFPDIVSDFFKVTGISFIQAMPIIWRVLYWINQMNQNKKLNIGIGELASVYDLSTYGSSRFLFKVKPGKNHLVLKSKRNDGPWKERFFFVKRASIPDGNLWPQEWVLQGRAIVIFRFSFYSDTYIPFSFFFDSAPRFEELAPESADTEEKIRSVFALSDIERSFRLELFPTQEASSNSEMTSGIFPFTLIL
jgi:hypothetical protein